MKLGIRTAAALVAVTFVFEPFISMLPTLDNALAPAQAEPIPAPLYRSEKSPPLADMSPPLIVIIAT